MINEVATLLCGLAVVIGILGTIIPVLPGSLLIAIAVLIWAIIVQTTAGWVVLVIVLALLGIGQLTQYLTAGKRMVGSGVPKKNLIIAGLCGIAGFFVIPLLGLPIGFVAGLTVAEYARHQTWDETWASTKVALQAVGLMLLIELSVAMLSGLTWVVGLFYGSAG